MGTAEVVKPFGTGRRPRVSLGLRLRFITSWWRGKGDDGATRDDLLSIFPGEGRCAPSLHTQVRILFTIIARLSLLVEGNRDIATNDATALSHCKTVRHGRTCRQWERELRVEILQSVAT